MTDSLQITVAAACGAVAPEPELKLMVLPGFDMEVEGAQCKAFGVKSSVERVIAKLEGKHWMFANSKKRLDVIRMCEDCRVNAMAEEQFDPFGAPLRPAPKTTDDFLRERDRSNGEKGS